MSHSAVAVSIGGAAAPESATGGGSSDLDVGASAKQPPPEALQDGDTSNSLEPGEVVTPPHHRLSSSPALKKQMPLGKTLRKTLNSHNHIKDADGCQEQVRALYELARKENGAQEAPMDEADDSEGLYSDTDSSVEDLKSVEDVQQARKEKQAEAAAAAALPQAPPTPFLGLSPLRFHMRAPPSCFDFPRMGFMPRMARGGPRGMRPPFFGRPPTPNRMLSGQSTVPGAAQFPVGGAGTHGSAGNNPGRSKRPQSDLSWTTLQPAVSFTFNLIPECSSTKHKDCKQKAESATADKSKEPPASDEKIKNAATEQSDPLRERSKEESQQNLPARSKTKERDQNRGNTRDRSQARDSTRGSSPERAREKSKARDSARGKTRERSKEKEFNRGKSRGASEQRKSRGNSQEGNQIRGKTRERSRARDQVRGKTREKSRERDQTREKSRERDQTREKTRERDQTRSKTVTEKTRQKDQTRDKDRKMSQERNQKRGTTRERSRERDRTRAKSRSKENPIEKLQDRKEKHSPKDKSSKIPDKPEKIIDKTKDKRHDRSRENHSDKSNENPRERSRRSSKERFHGNERVQQMEIKEQKEKLRDKKESTIEPAKDRPPRKSAERRRERSRDKLRERSRDTYSKEKSQEKPRREKAKHSKHDKSRDHSREKQSRSKRATTPHDSFGDTSQTHSKSCVSKEGTPPMTPPQQRAQTPPDSGDTPKTNLYDIFADSPPRQTNTAIAAVVSAVIIEGSTTPPLKAAPVTAPIAPILARPTKLTPLLKASEIHSRIGALLEDDDNDLHLEALLATKEQLFRRTNEYKERKEAPKEIKAEKEVEKRRYVNPFNRESVLSSGRKSYSCQRNGSRHSSDSEENWDRDEERERESSLPSRRGEFKDISIKIEKDLTPPPPQKTFSVTRIKVERNATPPRDRDRDVLVRNGAVAANAPPPSAKEQESPDTDDYIDNWENDDSISSMPKNIAPATPTPTPTPAPAPAAATNQNASINITTLPSQPAQFNEEYDEDEDDSNALWNANSTPPPRAKAAANLPMSNIHELYDKFMNSIDMGSAEMMEEDTSKNSSLSNSTAEDSSSGSSGTSSTSSSSSDSDDDDDSSSDDEEEEDGNQNTSGDDESPSAVGTAKSNPDDQPGGKEHQQKKNNVSKDLRKFKSLEDNLARIQMMRENYDAGDEISEELLKMESLFLMQRNAIMEKYRKQELKSNASEDQQQMEAPQVEAPVEQGSSAPVNSIFDANRGAIKMTISRLKLTSKSAIFDKDETDQQTAPTKLSLELPKPTLTLPLPPLKPPKEVAIVKPTIVESRTKPRVLRSPPPPGNRRRSRSRSISRNKSKRRSLRTKSRSPSPKRWRPPSPRRGSRFGKRNIGGAAAKMGRSHSRSLTRSRTRSRSPNRSRRRPPLTAGNRRRGSLSPGPTKVSGPRSPPHPRLRRSLTRERERERGDRDRRSRSPLPFKPPSPPMRRSWSHSRSPTRRRTRSRSRSPRFRSPRDGGQSFADYFGENQDMEAAAYYYNMSLMQQEYQDPTGTGYDTYAAYMDSAYNMEQAYAQFTEGYAQMYGDYPGEMDSSASPQLLGSSVLRELPMAPVPVAVQKGNVLEIVPTGEAAMQVVQDVSLRPVAAEEALEDESKPKRKRVNFVDNVLPNYESENEDRAVVSMAVERALCQHQERRSRAAARLQQIRDELLALPPPPPPLTPKPPNLEKPVLVQRKPKFRYFHFDPIKGAIVKTHSRVFRPNFRPPFDPKHFAMLIRTGRFPPFPPGFIRHRPPNIPAHVDPATKAAMLKEFFSKHPPPPLPMPMGMPMPMPNGMPYYLNGPPPMAAGASLSPVPQHIPVLGSHGYQGYAHPSPVPVPVPVPVPPVAASVPAAPTASTPPPAMIAPFFTPPPLPELLPKLPDLPTQFTVKSVPTITEIMPVDILQQLGPLPKTLDVDDGVGMASPELANTDLKEDDDADAAELEAGTNDEEQKSSGVEEENKTQPANGDPVEVPSLVGFF